jgi:hypothetical protein
MAASIKSDNQGENNVRFISITGIQNDMATLIIPNILGKSINTRGLPVMSTTPVAVYNIIIFVYKGMKIGSVTIKFSQVNSYECRKNRD